MSEQDHVSEAIGRIFQKIQSSAEHIQSLRFGGVVGKLSAVAVAGLLAIGAIGFKLQNLYVQILALLLASGLVIFVVLKVLRFAEKHPDLAILEGAELLQWHQLEYEVKGLLPPKNLPPITDPIALPSKDDKPGEER